MLRNFSPLSVVIIAVLAQYILKSACQLTLLEFSLIAHEKSLNHT